MKLAVATTGRQDLGILRSTILALDSADDFQLVLWAGGMHASSRFGEPYEGLGGRDFPPISRKLEFLAEPPYPSRDTGYAVLSASEAVALDDPEAVLLVGDRHETLGIAVASVLNGVPVVHIHGGEETPGALDNLFRHAISKLSHLHLVSHASHARRLARMGEDPSTIHVVGAPGLDNAYRVDLADRAEINRVLGRDLVDPVFLVSVHPTTSGADPLLAETDAIIEALDGTEGTIVFTIPNSDHGGVEIESAWRKAAQHDARILVVRQLGDRMYWSLLHHAACVIGNSSSGVIEAPSIGTPSVTVGDRQKSRLRHPDVEHVGADAEAVRNAIDRARSKPLRVSELYPTGEAAPRILAALRSWEVPTSLAKRFHEEN